MGLLLGGCPDKSATTTVEIEEAVQNLTVDVAVGDVVIRGKESGGTVITSDFVCRITPPAVNIHTEADQVTVEMPDGIGGASDCEGFFQIEIPRDASVAVRTGRGHLEISDVSGDVRLATYDGDVRLENLAGSLDVQVAVGRVRGEGIAGSVGRVYSGYGDVELSYGTTPAFVDVDIIHGDVALRVPENAYEISADTLEGNVDITGLKSHKGAERMLWLMVDTGNIRIAGHPE